ncbi:wall-associated receptor kinase 2-like [Hibiscus syriacus]|uniref:wall-associated receptor kinase 2-like n=1 Tax=Hibiscus syriacus TaxID=106335 RepID=UPI001922B3AA|nr:wall-associated receptor kinase 2-like [Hibiscus syriacus]
MAFICMLKEVALFAVALTLATASVASQSKPGCQSLCGNISIPYPFGTGESCNISSRHFIRCDTTLNLPRAFLSYPVPGGGYAEIRLLHISLDGYVFVTSSGNIGYYCYNSSGHDSGSSGRLSKGLWSYQFYFNNLGNHSGVLSFNPCNYGFIVEDGAHKFSVSDLNDTNFNQREFPRILDWTIGNQNCTEAQKDPQNYACKAHSACIDPDNNDGYLCKCVDGFRVTLISAVKILRNARLKPCSRVLGPSLVILILIAGVWRLIRKVVSNDGGLDKAKLVSSEELEAATDQYNKNRILGRGGQGCCLETEVPVLVYEFIPNGTLSHFIHDQNEEYPRSWDMRLRIAAAVASFIPSLVCIGPHLSPRYQIK